MNEKTVFEMSDDEVTYLAQTLSRDGITVIRVDLGGGKSLDCAGSCWRLNAVALPIGIRGSEVKAWYLENYPKNGGAE